MAENNIPLGINPKWSSADDTTAPSYLSSSNVAWMNIATIDQLDTLSARGEVMLKKLEGSIQAVTEDYQKRMSQQEEVVSSLYNQLLEAVENAERATTTSTQHSDHLNTLWRQCLGLKAEIQELTQNAHNEIVALKLAQTGSQEGIGVLTKRIYDNIIERTRELEVGFKAEMLEKLKTECSGLTIAIIQLRKEHEDLNDRVKQDHTFSIELNQVVASWIELNEGLKKDVKALREEAIPSQNMRNLTI